jgi:pyruvate formate lyase activating enzyme
MTAPVWEPAVLGHAVDGRRIACDLCPHACALHPGQTGLCRVRRNAGGELQTATMTVAVAHLDGIERKPLYHVRPGSRVLTIASPGCTFRCGYCINHRLSQFGRPGAPDWTGKPARPIELVAAAREQDAALGLSYTEPGLAPELTLALAEHAVPAGIPILWKTNGFLTASAVDLVAPVLDAVNIDIKAATDRAHRQLTGAPLGPVLDAIDRFRAAGVWVEVSTPLIPGSSADQADLATIATTLAAVDPDVPWHLLRFSPDYRMTAANPSSPDSLAAAREIGHLAGLRYVYVERALGPTGRHTRCPRCRAVLVERGIWNTLRDATLDGRCPRCAETIPGRWRSSHDRRA